MDDPTGSARTVPPETTDRIIDYLHDIPSALTSCSLVQKSWTTRAQWWLYTRISLRNRHAYPSLRRLKLQASTRAFLKHQCNHTTHLEITDDKEQPYAHVFPLTFINIFPQLTSLTYHDAQWSHLHPDPTILDSLSTFSSVTTLELRACQFSKFRDFVRVICALRSLCDLTVVRTNLGKPSRNTIEPTIASLGQALRLRHLRVQNLEQDETSLEGLLDWLSMTPSAGERCIQTLGIHLQDLTSGVLLHSPIHTILRQLGSSLTVLDIPVLQQGIGIQVGLNANDHVQSLILRYTFREEWDIAWANIGRMLSTITSPSLQNIELLFTIYRPAIDMNAAFKVMQSKDGWIPINLILGSGVFAELKKAAIVMEWYIEKSPPDAETRQLQISIEEAMKELEWHKRGILSITHHEHTLSVKPRPGQ